MRIVCDSCGKKYVISDDKVRGKLFKIRCKRCSHVIVVQGVEDPPATAEDDRTHVYSASAEQIAADMVTQSPPSVSGYQWHYVLDGEQAGPVSETEIAALYRDGIVPVARRDRRLGPPARRPGLRGPGRGGHPRARFLRR